MLNSHFLKKLLSEKWWKKELIVTGSVVTKVEEN